MRNAKADAEPHPADQEDRIIEMIEMNGKNMSNGRRCRSALCACLLAAALTAPAAAARDLEYNWFRVELILFERESADGTGNEMLKADTPREFPRHIVPLAYDDATLQAVYRLSDEQVAALRLPEPRTEFDELPTQTHDSRLPAPLAPDGDLPAADSAVSQVGEPIFILAEVPELSAAEREARERAEALREFEAGLLASAFRPVPQMELALGREAARLRTSRSFDVVWHGAWVQPVPGRTQPLPVLFQAGPRSGERWAYEGTVAVTLGRFLHLHADLWSEADEMPVDQLPHGAFGPPRAANASRERTYQRLNEQRRMRSSEVHYLDHPRFGILVRIDSVEPPEELIAPLTLPEQ
jgi:hypothetical protein